MSVQAGIWNFEGASVEKQSLMKMSETMTQYGPDGESIYLDGGIGIVYRPFYTTCESYLEHQPYVSATGLVITWDGRLDNREGLLSQLRNDLMDDLSDAAITAAAINRWGLGAFENLIGDWALSVWNPLEKELVLARDYIGCKRLFYSPTATKVIWCSCLDSLTLSNGRFTLCDEFIAGDLALRAPDHLTPFQGIYSVPPASVVRIRAEDISVHRYWAFDARKQTRYKTDADYEEHFRHLFRQAVRRRLRSSSPVLAELSGGYDSSSIVCVADDILKEEGAQCKSLDTFSYSYLDEPDGDDALYFTKVEERRGRRGHRVEIRGSGDSFSPEFGYAVATPVFLGRAEVHVARSQVIKDGKYRVTLSGIGGDELLGQSLDPMTVMGDALVQMRLWTLARLLTSWSVIMRRSWLQLLGESLFRLLPTAVRALVESEGKVELWVNRKFARIHKLSRVLLPAAEGRWFWRPSARHALQQYEVLVYILTNYLPRTDELRYPFLDQDLSDFLMSVPCDQLYRPGNRRSLMRRALVNILPKEILSRRTKQIESRCYCVTARKHWGRLESIFTSPITSSLGYINQSTFQSALVDLKNGKPPRNSNLLMTGLFLELWLRDGLKRGVISVPRHLEEIATLKSLLLEV